MRILIINMARETERLAFQERQMRALALPFEIFAAITTDTIPSGIKEAYWQTWERPLRPEERACFLSHRTLWQSIVDTDAPALILEDDALLSKKTPDLLKQLGKLGPNPTHFQHLSLEVRNRKKLISIRPHTSLENGANIHRLYQDRSGAAAYILWPSGAKLLLNRIKHKAGLADAIICSTPAFGSYQLNPAYAVQFDKCEFYGIDPPFATSSATNYRSKIRGHSFWQRSRYKIRRINSQIRMGWRRAVNLGRAKRIYLDLG